MRHGFLLPWGVARSGRGRRVGILCSEYDPAGLCKAGFRIVRVR
ncbi:protein of unknown function [Cupriavidus taiwanensis]|uniref:Uncharacterized protein n=1 Tax=Cupriavidus taiwanensis TaxID=164546 RepID=A0A7Z7NKV9_9BURK|nr:hypothetical protein CBM2585_A80032 [Cupriavidus taiwanensis]SOY85973.1 protein of unknown function [Cupriavidus taiwanensis]SOZ02039.1 hypothetical protein CBM2595_A30846 [Cupriavidus taiwanensis]SOZ05027.1 hypothetical protein CBM2597_A50979 [Cupriavidus taiwanensis]SPC09509.1 hypothetical protein CBM2594_A40832 [Cupriavidus taiwanensis]